MLVTFRKVKKGISEPYYRFEKPPPTTEDGSDSGVEGVIEGSDEDRVDVTG